MTLPPTVSGARPLLGHTREFLRDPGELVRRGHAEHGRMFSVRLPGGPGVVLLGQDNAKFFHAESDALRLSIREAYRFLEHMFVHNTFWLAEHEEYLRQRAVLAPQFRGGRVRRHVAEMDRRTTALIDSLPDAGTFEPTDLLGPLVIEIATSLFLGDDAASRFRGLQSEFRAFADGMDPLLPGWVPAPHLLRSHRARDRLRRITSALVAERRAIPAEEPDFLELMANAPLRDDDLLADLVVMLVWVGHETTTGHLCWALIDLLRHPHELARVHDEAFLGRALKESERLHPVTPFLARVATVDIPHETYVIPRGAAVMLHPGVSHRDAGVFSDPGEYRPDRFLTEPASALQAFGGGIHRCLGEHFAQLEMKVVITRLAEHLEMRLLDGDPVAVRGHRSNWPRRPCRVAYAKRLPQFSPT
ncbi:cytochrome P450 [Lentzea aerocolonigenes]|uniref:cytochrome P450 n=1 Tax=Lentzea aerocolonigenes TaxID=68170 RepID=UPI0018C88867|nr:cytochrome P450 [Lentzea aerocolonigenes]